MNNQQTPGKYDAVLGGENQPSEGAAVLGGIEGVKLQLNNPNPQIRIAGIRQAFNYGEAGLDLVIQALDDESIEIQDAADVLLGEYHERLFHNEIAQIAEDYKVGKLTEQEAIALEINAIGKLRDWLSDENVDFICEELGYDSEDVANYLDAQEDEDGDYSSRTNLAEYHKHLFDTAVAQIEEAFNAGELTEQEAIALEINAIGELRDRLSDEKIDYICEELGYDPEEVANYLDAEEYEHDEEDDDDEYEEVNYSSGTNLADFQAGNAFGFHLTTLLLGKGYKDIESDMVEFTSVLGLTGEEVAGLITGDYVPTEETVAKLAEFFQLDDDQIDALASSAYEAWEEAGYEIEETGLLHDEEKEDSD
jgi:hypothetical protein